jgi:hypothetical protein
MGRASLRSSGQPSNSTASSTASLSGSEPAAPESTGSAEPDAPDAGARDAEALTQPSKILLAGVPALTVALAAVGGATGGLARMVRGPDRHRTGLHRFDLPRVRAGGAGSPARDHIRLLGGGGSPTRQRSLILLASGLVLVIGIALALNAQIIVMGYGQAPVVTGTVTPTSAGDALVLQPEIVMTMVERLVGAGSGWCGRGVDGVGATVTRPWGRPVLGLVRSHRS